jgi:hypothetical protein
MGRATRLPAALFSVHFIRFFNGSFKVANSKNPAVKEEIKITNFNL